MDELSGSVERITYYNPENGYSVLRLRPDRRIAGADREDLVTVVGNLPELSPGERLHLRGRWSRHPRHGQQFQVEVCERSLPATAAGICRYLGSGLVRGIGPRLAERIVAHFGVQTLEVIEHQPERLREVPDIGPKRSQLIAQAWQEQKQVKQLMLFLHSHGVSTNLAVKIYRQYGDAALEVVQTDPYRLASDIYGVGFKTADRLAQALGLPGDHPSRLEAGLVYSLNAMVDDGHVFTPQAELIERAANLLEVPAGLVASALERLAQQQRVRLEALPLPAPARSPAEGRKVGEAPAAYAQPAVYLPPLYLGETSVAERLRALATTPAGESWRAELRGGPAADSLPLTAEQQQAIRIALERPLSVLTGGPGTGKTTCIRLLIAALEGERRRYALASPTGRAAKRLSEATGRPASTIHRLLGFSPGEGFKYNERNPLPVDLLVVDEASMLDLLLAHHLLKALRPGVHLLLVGDAVQLPSVGAGDVLRDVIASGVAPVTRLSAIFRQPAGSHIISNAHRINQGLAPLFPPDSGDFFLFPAESAGQAAEWVLEVTCRRIPQRFGLDPLRQVQALAPMYRGPAGVHALNAALQAALNPPAAHKAERQLFGQTLRQGDKVMQALNNYDKDVFNGDIGFITALDALEQTLMVDFDGRQVTYDWSEADQLVLAYAISVHKAQGSEFPAVVLPVITAHYLMLQRNLLYTAVTRAQSLCVLVGSRRAIGMAVKNDRLARRYTALDWRLGRGKL